MLSLNKYSFLILPIFIGIFVVLECFVILGSQNALARAVQEENDRFARETFNLISESAATLSTSTLSTGKTTNATANTEQSALLAEQKPVLVEMFLSQSCSSCVPAAGYVRDLAKRDDVVVLSWHVDYWDDLYVSGHGRWKDPYSSASYTNRQRDYAINNQSGGRIYTPQAIINGTSETVGSRQNRVEPLLTASSVESSKNNIALSVTRQGDQLVTSLSGNVIGLETYLVSFHKKTATSILGGENAGQEWSEANVVASVRMIGNGSNLNTTLKPTEFSDDTGCAIIVQQPNLGSVVAASYCPA